MQKQTKAGQRGILIMAAVLVALIAAAVVIYFNQRNAGEAVSIEENERYGDIPLAGQYAAAREITRGAAVPEGVSRGIDAAGVPYIGDPNAPITIAEFMDFTCPHCATYSATFDRLVQDFGRTGLANFQLYILPAEARAPQSRYGARAALCAAQQGAFWEMHDELFRVHLAESTNAFDEAGVVAMAERIGLDGEALRACINSNTADTALFSAASLARENNFEATPTLLYRLGGTTTWVTLPSSDGQIVGGRDYEEIARLIRQANGLETDN